LDYLDRNALLTFVQCRSRAFWPADGRGSFRADYPISLSYRWGSPEWLDMRQRLGELGGTKGYTVRHQRGIYKTIKNTGLM
jgi:hypothetical protein